MLRNKSEPEAPTPARKLVIVENDVAVLSMVSRHFSSRGWNVIGAGSTAAGLLSLDPLPECVILDLMEPGKGGELLLWKIRSEKLPVRVVVTAGPCDPERRRAVASLRPEALLEKPYDLDALYRACHGGPAPTDGPDRARDESPPDDA